MFIVVLLLATNALDQVLGPVVYALKHGLLSQWA